jgi:hypothetical protein
MPENKSDDGIYYDEISTISDKSDPPIPPQPTQEDPCPTPSCGESFLNTIATSVFLCYWVCCLE